MDPRQRRWWNLLDALPSRLGQVHVWTEAGHQIPTDTSWHFHTMPTFVACLEGVVRVCSQQEHLDLHPGDALLIAPGVWHGHAPLMPGSIACTQGFMTTWSDLELADCAGSWFGRVPRDPCRELLEDAIEASEPGIRRVYTLQFITRLLAEDILPWDRTHPALMRMVARLWSGIHLGVQVDDLVRVSGLSRAQAYRVFTAGYGASPRAAIAEARACLAQGLSRMGLSLPEVAAHSGYQCIRTCQRALMQWETQSKTQRRIAV